MVKKTLSPNYCNVIDHRKVPLMNRKKANKDRFVETGPYLFSDVLK